MRATDKTKLAKIGVTITKQLKEKFSLNDERTQTIKNSLPQIHCQQVTSASLPKALLVDIDQPEPANVISATTLADGSIQFHQRRGGSTMPIIERVTYHPRQVEAVLYTSMMNDTIKYGGDIWLNHATWRRNSKGILVPRAKSGTAETGRDVSHLFAVDLQHEKAATAQAPVRPTRQKPVPRPKRTKEDPKRNVDLEFERLIQADK